jgi:hypothetical protein
MTQLAQELMTPHEAARWFRRSPSWLRQQPALLRLRAPGGQPLFHIRVCRAFVLGRLCGLEGDQLRQAQLKALAAACGLTDQDPALLPALCPTTRAPAAAAPIGN